MGSTNTPTVSPGGVRVNAYERVFGTGPRGTLISVLLLGATAYLLPIVGLPSVHGVPLVGERHAQDPGGGWMTNRGVARGSRSTISIQPT